MHAGKVQRNDRMSMIGPVASHGALFVGPPGGSETRIAATCTLRRRPRLPSQSEYSCQCKAQAQGDLKRVAVCWKNFAQLQHLPILSDQSIDLLQTGPF
jgi:hypothetical protein